MKDEQKDLLNHFRQQQEKYVYYVIALSVASIAFAIQKTNGQHLKLIQIPLAVAVLSWGISIFCGLTFLKYSISTLYANNAYFDIISGHHPEVGNNPQFIEAAATGTLEAIKINSERASQYGKWQNRLFYIGIISFIVWHVIEMYAIRPNT